MKYSIKIIAKFRGVNDTTYSIPAEEAHKAYYLWHNPEKRGVFNSGLALKGDDIDRIVPDYHGTMGWNKTHKLSDDDWNDMNTRGITDKLQSICSKAEKVARLENPQLDKALPEAVKALPQLAHSKETEQLANSMKV